MKNFLTRIVNSVKQLFKSVDRIITFILSIAGLVYSIGYYSGTYQFAVELGSWCLLAISFRHFLFNIEKHEMKKFICFSLLFFIICFVYTLCRQVKDALVIAKNGAKASTYTKILVLLMAVPYTYLYAKIAKKVNYKYLGIISILPILGYFIIFKFFLYNNHAILPSTDAVTAFSKLWIIGGFYTQFASWPIALYYILAEMWAVSLMGAFIWQLINAYSKAEERKKFYGAILLTGQFTTLMVSAFLKYTIKKAETHGYEYVINLSTYLYIFAGISISFILYYFFKDNPEIEGGAKKEKVKIENFSIMDTIKSNKNFFFAASLVILYGFSCIFLEQSWKENVRLIYNTESKYGAFTAWALLWQSRIAIILAMLGSGFFLQNMSWFFCAAVTPLVTLLSTIFIFGFALFKSSIPGIQNPLLISCIAGAIFIGVFKGAKYSLFDATKELYIAKQSQENKNNIKYLESSLNRVGKSGGSILMYIIFETGRSFGYHFSYASTEIVMFLFAFMGILVFMWYTAVYSISKEMKD